MHIANALVRTLCAALRSMSVTDVVVCPGSRNAPIVLELSNDSSFRLHGAIDERAAAFYALGLAAGNQHLTALVVTSGTALLNAAPAIAEAKYQGIPLIVIAADRPIEWREQGDGQTIDQPNALRSLFRAVADLAETSLNNYSINNNLPTTSDHTAQWHLERQLRATIMTATSGNRGPVLLNIALREPLLTFAPTPTTTIPPLAHLAPNGDNVAQAVAQILLKAERPLIVVGHLGYEPERQKLCPYARLLQDKWWICEERIGGLLGGTRPEQCLALAEQLHLDMAPDYVLHIGGSFISKRLRQLIRDAKLCHVIQLSQEPIVVDTFQHIDLLAQCQPEAMLKALADCPQRPANEAAEYCAQWSQLLEQVAETDAPLKCISEAEHQAGDALRCYANSSAVRLGERSAFGHVFCNRGTNGIDGCVSTALGLASGSQTRTLLVVGDLAFGYDSNALWATAAQLHQADLRILLLNNGGGGIFARFDDLNGQPARNLIVGTSTRRFKGLAEDLELEYQQVDGDGAHSERLLWLLEPTNLPSVRILEVIL